MPNRKNVPPFSSSLYRYRNLVERFFNKIKHYRAIAKPLSNATQNRLFAPVHRENELTYRITAARSSPYRWNLSAPRMSVDVVCATAADALDEIRITGSGSASQTVTLRMDAKAAAREFELTVAGWRGNDRSAKKAFILKHLSLAPGAALSVGLSDGGK